MTIANLNHMEVDGNDWQQWKARIWNSMADRFGYPGLAPLEQWMLRSQKEKRCINCGDPTTASTESVLIKSVRLYYHCPKCQALYDNDREGAGSAKGEA